MSRSNRRSRPRGASPASVVASRRYMRNATRRPDGTIVGFDRSTLGEIVKDGTQLAAKLWPDRFSDPAQVSTRFFNKARLQLKSKYGRKPPQAHAISKGLPDYEGNPWPWPDLAATANDPSRGFARSDQARLGRPDLSLNDHRLEYALLRVAYLRKEKTLYPHAYQEGFEQLTQNGVTRHGTAERVWFDLLLPSEGQLQHYLNNDWGRGVKQAGLQAPPPLRPPENQSGLPRDWGILLFYAEHGWLPLRCELEAFARRRFALGDDNDLPHPEWTRQGIERIAELGLPAPPPFEIRTAPGWMPIQVDIGPLPPPGRTRYSMREIFEWLRLFRLQPASRQVSRQRRWKAFARETGAPGWDVLRRRGGIDKLIRIAARDDWEAQAARLDATQTKPAPAKPTPRRETRPTPTRELIRIAEHEKAQTILEQLEKNGVMTARELSTALKFPGRTIRYYLHALLATKQIDRARRLQRGRVIAAYTIAQSGMGK